MENPIKMDDLGGTPIFGSTQVLGIVSGDFLLSILVKSPFFTTIWDNMFYFFQASYANIRVLRKFT